VRAPAPLLAARSAGAPSASAASSVICTAPSADRAPAPPSTREAGGKPAPEPAPAAAAASDAAARPARAGSHAAPVVGASQGDRPRLPLKGKARSAGLPPAAQARPRRTEQVGKGRRGTRSAARTGWRPGRGALPGLEPRRQARRRWRRGRVGRRVHDVAADARRRLALLQHLQHLRHGRACRLGRTDPAPPCLALLQHLQHLRHGRA